MLYPSSVEVLPLDTQQVDDYFKRVGRPLAVRTALHSNAVLRELVTTPLMLSIVMLTYRGKAAKDLPQLGTKEEQQRQVFERCVARMLEQPTRKWSYTSQQTQTWLIWLAQQMKQHQLSDFYLERLQPSWVPTKQTQVFYHWLTMLGGVLLVGESSTNIQPAERLSWSRNRFSIVLVSGLVAGLVFGLVFGLLAVLFFGGDAYLYHYILRFLLRQSGTMPWHAVRLLNEATERILLHPVGGGYRFIHPLLQDYFASLNRTSSSTNSAEQLPQIPPSTETT